MLLLNTGHEWLYTCKYALFASNVYLSILFLKQVWVILLYRSSSENNRPTCMLQLINMFYYESIVECHLISIRSTYQCRKAGLSLICKSPGILWMMINDPNCGNFLKFYLVGGGGHCKNASIIFVRWALIISSWSNYILQKFFHFKSFPAESKIYS